MNKWKLVFTGAAVAVFAGFTVVGYAQNPNTGTGQQSQGRRQAGQRRQGGQRGQVGLAALPVETIDKLVTLTSEQKTKITAIHDKYAEDAKGLRPQPGQQADPANRQKLRELTTNANRDIQALLTEDQKKKLGEARQELTVLQAAGAPPAMVGELKFTDDQKKKIADIRKESQEKLRALTPEERRTKGREIQQETRAKVEAVLTDDQKAQIEKYRKEHPGRNRRRP